MRSTAAARRPIRVFFDASALFAAAYSATGASRSLLLAAARGELTLVISQDVLEEVERNLSRKAPRALPAYRLFIALVAPEIIADPAIDEVRAAAEHVPAKDAPIIAAVRKAAPDFFVTLDRRHLLGKPAVARFVGTPILTPAEALDRLRALGEGDQ